MAPLAFNASGFVSPWVGPFDTVSFRSIEAACEGETPSEMSAIMPGIAKLRSNVAKETTSTLKKSGISFPAHFTEVAHHDARDARYQ